MTDIDKINLLNAISIAGADDLRKIIKKLEVMRPSSVIDELIDVAEDNLLSLSGWGGDY